MDQIIFCALGFGAIFCAYRAMVSQKLLSSILYLACVSALISVVLYIIGAQQVAVIELSVGAGLVTVLMVYALSVVGEDAFDPLSVIPKPLAALVVVFVVLLFGYLLLPLKKAPLGGVSPSVTFVLWQRRMLDVWIQIALIFSGILGVLGLLAEKNTGNEAEK